MGLLARFILGPWDKKGSASAWSVVFNTSQVEEGEKRNTSHPTPASTLPSVKASRRLAQGCPLLEVSRAPEISGRRWLPNLSAGISYAIVMLVKDTGLFACINVNTKCIY